MRNAFVGISITVATTTLVVATLTVYLHSWTLQSQEEKLKRMEAIQKGNPDALYSIGLGYKKQGDYVAAVSLYTLAAERGNMYAQNDVGSFYIEGQGVQKDLEKALHYYEMAVKQGDKFAEQAAGAIYLDIENKGQEHYKNTERAKILLERAASQGMKESKYYLGRMYNEGIGVNVDKERARTLFASAASANSLRAQWELGAMYLNYFNQRTEAFKWFKLAADNHGDAYSQYNVGSMLLNGDGMEQDYVAAVPYLTKSSDQGFLPADHNLGLMYHWGLGVNQDSIKGREYLLRAANDGYNSESQVSLAGHMYEEGDHIRSAAYAMRAAEQGQARAQYFLGMLLTRGDGIPVDKERGINWLRRAAANGEQHASDALKAIDKRENVGDIAIVSSAEGSGVRHLRA
eukprot:gb/GECG01015490.1/.p1 GENE.gb/GECG01015490.1/~~gb/GECG01015490.1/.p1  ORF type:complete len:403 (+),score=54.12 gb/GECG01015490.1/:1-1209(+)